MTDDEKLAIEAQIIADVTQGIKNIETPDESVELFDAKSRLEALAILENRAATVTASANPFKCLRRTQCLPPGGGG